MSRGKDTGLELKSWAGSGSGIVELTRHYMDGIPSY